MQYLPPKHGFLQDPHGVKSVKLKSYPRHRPLRIQGCLDSGLKDGAEVVSLKHRLRSTSQKPVQCLLQPTPERPISALGCVTLQQAIAETPLKRSAYNIQGLILVLGFSLLVSFLQATTGLVPISYRRVLRNTLLHVSLIPTSYKRPSAYQLQRSATEHSSTCKSHSHEPQQA
jgi:hypothetical protein